MATSIMEGVDVVVVEFFPTEMRAERNGCPDTFSSRSEVTLNVHCSQRWMNIGISTMPRMSPLEDSCPSVECSDNF